MCIVEVLDETFETVFPLRPNNENVINETPPCVGFIAACEINCKRLGDTMFCGWLSVGFMKTSVSSLPESLITLTSKNSIPLQDHFDVNFIVLCALLRYSKLLRLSSPSVQIMKMSSMKRHHFDVNFIVLCALLRYSMKLLRLSSPSVQIMKMSSMKRHHVWGLLLLAKLIASLVYSWIYWHTMEPCEFLSLFPASAHSACHQIQNYYF